MLNDTDKFLVNDGTQTETVTFAQYKDGTVLNDTDKFLVNDGTKTETVTWATLKEEGGGGGGGAVISVNCTLVASAEYQPSTLTATTATVINGTKVESYPAWYKDGVEIPGATGLTYNVSVSGVYKYEERWVGGDGISVYPSASITIKQAVVAKPTVIAPADGAGIGEDVTYTPKTSAIDDVESTEIVSGWSTATVNPNGQTNLPFVIATDGKGTWMTVGDFDTPVFRSTDNGANWAPVGSAPPWGNNHGAYGMTWGNPGGVDTWVIVVFTNGDASSNVWWSQDDGLTWNAGTGISAMSFYWVTWSPEQEKFFAVGDASLSPTNYNYASSTDGKVFGNEKFNNFDNNSTYYSVTAGPSNTVVACGYKNLSYSTDGGDTWNKGQGPSGITEQYWYSVDYYDGWYVAVTYSDPTYVARSQDGINWEWGNGGNFISLTNPRIIKGGQGKFVIVDTVAPNSGKKAWAWSEDHGDTWTISEESITTGYWNSLDYGNNMWIAAAYDKDSNLYLRSATGSDDDINLTTLTLTNANTYNADDDSDMNQAISQTFSAGDTVKGTILPFDPDLQTAAFTSTLYDGTNGGNIPTGVDNTSKALVWIKNTEVDNHLLYDTTRGGGYYFHTNDTKEPIYSATGGLQRFDSDGFTLGEGLHGSNASSVAAWNFRAAPTFFDIVEYEGNGGVKNVPHGLTTVPGAIVCKRTNNNSNWCVYHQGLGNEKLIQLNDSSAAGSASQQWWNNTTPTDQVFTLGNSPAMNTDEGQYVAYVFADTAGKIKCGSTPSNNAGSQQECGFKPGWLLIKSTDEGNWFIIDNKRGVGEGATYKLEADLDSAQTGPNSVVFNDTGFTQTLMSHESIWIAIAEDVEAGQMPALKRAFSTKLYPGNDTTQTVSTGIDNTGKSLLWCKATDQAYHHSLVDNVRGGFKALKSDDTGSEMTYADITSFNSNGFTTINMTGYVNQGNTDFVAWNFRGAPGFFDIQTWKGEDGSVDRTINHSLNIAPGFVICKSYSNSGTQWYMYHKEWGVDRYADFTSGGANDSAGAWKDVTDKTFGFGPNANLNAEGRDHVAYLFADNPDGGIKCGKYNGEANQTVLTGFKTGWVLIKSFGGENWQIYDSSRVGPLYPNLSSINPADDYIDFDVPDGFKFKSSNNSVNGNNLSYVYVAIAEDAMAGEFPPTGTLTADANDTDKSITLTDVKGVWKKEMEVINDKTVTEAAPDPDTLEFVGSVPAASAGTISSWGDATWTVTDKSDSSTQTQTKSITSGQQQRLTAAESGMTLSPGTTYDVTVKYEAPDAVGATSDANTFKTSGVNIPSKGWNAIKADPASRRMQSLTYGNNKFVGVFLEDGNYKIGISTDNGGTFTLNDSLDSWNSGAGYKQILFEPDGKFFVLLARNAVTQTERLLYSETAEVWSILTNYPVDGLRGMAVGTKSDGSKNVAISNYGSGIYYTTDGWSTWQSSSVPAGTGYYGTGCFGKGSAIFSNSDDGAFVFTASNPVKLVCSSDNCASFNICALGGGGNPPDIEDVTFNPTNEMFVAVGRFGDTNKRIYYSTDGINYLPANMDPGIQGISLWVVRPLPGSSAFVAVGEQGPNNTRAVYSSDGINWVATGPFPPQEYYSLAASSNNFVAGSNNAGIDNYVLLSRTGEPLSMTLFYDTNNKEGIIGNDIIKKYGVTPGSDAAKQLGFAELTEQPDYQVAGYELQGDGRYRPIEDQHAEVRELKKELLKSEIEKAALKREIKEAEAKEEESE